jgi:hypothetical protein
MMNLVSTQSPEQSQQQRFAQGPTAPPSAVPQGLDPMIMFLVQMMMRRGGSPSASTPFSPDANPGLTF